MHPISRRTLLIIYDVLHYLCMHGPNVTRDELVDYLHRATSHKHTSFESRLRAFERFKNNLSRLGITHFTLVTTGPHSGPTVFTVKRPANALAIVRASLDAPANTHANLEEATPS